MHKKKYFLNHSEIPTSNIQNETLKSFFVQNNFNTVTHTHVRKRNFIVFDNFANFFCSKKISNLNQFYDQIDSYLPTKFSIQCLGDVFFCGLLVCDGFRFGPLWSIDNEGWSLTSGVSYLLCLFFTNFQFIKRRKGCPFKFWNYIFSVQILQKAAK